MLSRFDGMVTMRTSTKVLGAVIILMASGCAENTGDKVPIDAYQDATHAALEFHEPSAETVTVPAEEASGEAVPTLVPQTNGSPLRVGGATIVPPEDWQVSGVAESFGGQHVSAMSPAGDYVSLRSVPKNCDIDELIDSALKADPENCVEASTLVVGGKRLRGVRTSLVSSGGNVVDVQYFGAAQDAVFIIQVVASPDSVEAVVAQLSETLTME